VISGVGKTKLIAVSPYDITLVVKPRTPNNDVLLEATGIAVIAVGEEVWTVVEAGTELGPLLLVINDDIPAVVSV
jgi:hypothetical protein